MNNCHIYVFKRKKKHYWGGYEQPTVSGNETILLWNIYLAFIPDKIGEFVFAFLKNIKVILPSQT